MLLVLLLGWRTVAPQAPQMEIPVSLVAPPALTPAPQPSSAPKAKAEPKATAAPAAAAAKSAPAPAIVARRSPAPPAPASPPMARVQPAASHTSLDQLVDAQMAAARAEPGGGEGEGVGAGQGLGTGGGGCDMAGRVQAALRKDPLVRAAVHAAGAGAIVVWNGDWVQASEEDGKGLAAVREAITWEVAFAPAACRQQRMRGQVLLSLNDGSARLALGAGEWRWSDLLGLR